MNRSGLSAFRRSRSFFIVAGGEYATGGDGGRGMLGRRTGRRRVFGFRPIHHTFGNGVDASTGSSLAATATNSRSNGSAAGGVEVSGTAVGLSTPSATACG